ncbi:SCO family protein [Arcticibacter sp. MXS-1]|uniref:SCO family protein n=1 Tax=Arcticibacter sp. MXS-1 TaxID=3341726 RepID=UPI0035A9AB55
MSRTSLKKVLILASILAVPGFLYFLLQDKGKNRYRPLKIFGPKEVAATFHYKRGKKIPDTIYHQVAPFHLVDQSAAAVAYPEDTTQIAIFNFFYTSCASCARANESMASVARDYLKNKRVHFYSVSVDPLKDQPEVLSVYSKQYGIPMSKWTFLTGDRGTIYTWAKREFLVDVYRADSSAVIHRPLLILVDTKRRIRGFYEATSKEQVDKLRDEIKVLIAEELRQVADL